MRDGHVEARLRRAHAQADVRARQLARGGLELPAREVQPDAVIDASAVHRERQLHVARERRQIDRASRGIEVPGPVRGRAHRGERLVAEVRAEVERSVQQIAGGGRLQREPVTRAVVFYRHLKTLECDFERGALGIAPAQRAVAQEDSLLAEQPRGECVRIRAMLRNWHTSDADLSVRVACDDHVRPIDGEIREPRLHMQQRRPRALACGTARPGEPSAASMRRLSMSSVGCSPDHRRCGRYATARKSSTKPSAQCVGKTHRPAAAGYRCPPPRSTPRRRSQAGFSGHATGRARRCRWAWLVQLRSGRRIVCCRTCCGVRAIW